MSIPIVILNRDRLQTTEKLIDQLLMLGYEDIYILDIDSTYPPLLQYYENTPAIVLPAGGNIGHKGFWNNGIIGRFRDHEFIVVTDSDIELHPDTPKGFIEQMVLVAKDLRVNKVGLAIQYDDISNQYLKKIIEPIESQYWQQRVNHKLICYNALVDTTFCIVRPTVPFQYQAIRVANWPITHVDWYSQWDDLTEEEQYYMEHTDENISTTKAHFMRYLMSI